MYIEGPLRSGKTSRLMDKYIELVVSGVSTSEILVVTANSFKKRLFVETIKERLLGCPVRGFGDFQVYTFNGIIYNYILRNWPVIENIISTRDDNAVIIPNLCGLESTEYILKLCINRINQEQDISNTFKDYGSEMNLRHQLLRRYRLITENCLTEEEITDRARVLNEGFKDPADHALGDLKNMTLSLRSIDFAGQTDLFMELIKNSALFEKDFGRIKYLLADDVDEYSYAGQTFLKELLSSVDEFYLCADPDGGTRRGYLCAYPEGWEEIKGFKKDDVVKLDTVKALRDDAESLFKALKYDSPTELEHIKLVSEIKRAEMLDSALSKIKELVKEQKINPEDIIVVTPIIDESIKFTLVNFFEQERLQYQFLSGTKKLINNAGVFSSLIIAQLINDKWKFKPSEFEIRILLTGLFSIPVQLCKSVLDYYKKHKKLDSNLNSDYEEFDDQYLKLIGTVNRIKEKDLTLYEQLIEIFNLLIAPGIQDSGDLDDINEVLKSLDGFMKIINRLEEKPDNPEREWLVQIKNTVVSDNPPSAPEIKSDSIIIATPQRVVDLELESKYQIWLDVAGIVWTKDDTGPMYNSWVYRKNWDREAYTPEIHKELTMIKTAHLLRKLVLCADKEIIAYASQIDSAGNENIGVLHHYLDGEAEESAKNFKVIVPREDQRPVLEYSGGKMAVPAVPGAGKTTIMQALIIEMIKKGIKPGEILVLTYMESAARMFQERIKRNCPELNELPYISTIHGLAYKIIQDEDNVVKLGLNSDFQLCDDVDRSKIIQDICSRYLPEGEEDLSKWIELNVRAISKAKLADLSWQEIGRYLRSHTNQQLMEFLPVYKAYIETMREKNLIDFDDLLIMSTKLLKNHPDIRKYYQKQYRFVIEDEAQDSSQIQQEFISIISEYHGNLIRCGDANQAITTTFTNADVQGFRDFIRENYKVEMQSSQRCASEIYELANHLIDWTKSFEHLQGAFLDLKMLPVEGKNPDVKDSLYFKVLDNPISEKSWILGEIQKLQKQNPDLTFGILLRANWQVFEWSAYLDKNNIKYICFTDTLKQKKVFRFLLKFLEVLENPWNNTLIYELYEEFINAKIYPREFESVDFIKNKLGSPFISLESSDLISEYLIKYWWDVHYWLDNSYLSPEELILKIGSYYFDNIIDKSNVHLLSVLIKKFKNTFTDYSDNSKVVNLPEIVKHFKELRNKNKIGGVRFFTESEEGNLLSGYVQIMTVHKAKGDEFDVVFMPEMHEGSYSISPEYTKIRQEDILLDKINEIAKSGKSKTEIDMQIGQMEENLRLLYVGMTRAKRYLYMSSYRKSTNKWNKSRDNQPSKVLEYFISMMGSAPRLYVASDNQAVINKPESKSLQIEVPLE